MNQMLKGALIAIGVIVVLALVTYAGFGLLGCHDYSKPCSAEEQLAHKFGYDAGFDAATLKAAAKEQQRVNDMIAFHLSEERVKDRDAVIQKLEGRIKDLENHPPAERVRSHESSDSGSKSNPCDALWSQADKVICNNTRPK